MNGFNIRRTFSKISLLWTEDLAEVDKSSPEFLIPKNGGLGISFPAFLGSGNVHRDGSNGEAVDIIQKLGMFRLKLLQMARAGKKL